MKISNPFPLHTWAIIAVLVLALLTLGYCQVTKPSRNAAKRAEAGQTLAEGRTAAAQDASAVRDRADARDDQITTTTKESTDAIRQAPDRDAAGRAALDGLCRLYPDGDPRCRVLDPDPRRVD